MVSIELMGNFAKTSAALCAASFVMGQSQEAMANSGESHNSGSQEAYTFALGASPVAPGARLLLKSSRINPNLIDNNPIPVSTPGAIDPLGETTEVHEGLVEGGVKIEPWMIERYKKAIDKLVPDLRKVTPVKRPGLLQLLSPWLIY